MLVELAGDTIWLRSSYQQNELVKAIPGVRWHPTHRQWHVPLSWAACVTMRGIFGAELEVGPELSKWSQEELARRVGPCLELRDAEDLSEDHWVAKRLSELGLG